MSLLTFSLSFTLFRRQWQRLFRHPQEFIRGTSGPFIHIMESNPAYYEKADSSFLCLTSTHWSLLHTKLCTKRTRNLRIILLRALLLSNLEPTPTSLLRNTPRLQPETAFFVFHACIQFSSFCHTCHPSFLVRRRFYSTSVDVFLFYVSV